MAASLEFGGVGEDREQSGDRVGILDLLTRVEGNEICECWWCVGNGREVKERVFESENGVAGFGVLMVFV